MTPKLRNVLFKVAALCSALVIGGGYVVWRGAEARSAEQRELNSKAKAKEELELMVGSKNPGSALLSHNEIEGVLREPDDASNVITDFLDAPEKVEEGGTLLPGSKSISMPLFSKRKTNDAIEIIDDEIVPLPLDGQRPNLLPSSKAGIFIPREPEPEKSE